MTTDRTDDAGVPLRWRRPVRSAIVRSCFGWRRPSRMIVKTATCVVSVLFLASCLLPRPVHAQQEEPWLIFDPLHGDISLRYEDVDVRSQSSGKTARDQYYFNYEEVNFRQRITVYDPRFIDLDLGLGAQLRQGHHDREGQEARLIKYDLAASILREKPVSFSAYAAKYQDETRQAPTAIALESRQEQSMGVLVQEETGSPMPVSVRYSSTERSYDNRFTQPVAATSSNQILAQQEATRTLDISSAKHTPDFSLDWHAQQREVNTIQDSAGVHSESQYEQARYDLSSSGHAGENHRLGWRLALLHRSQTRFPEQKLSSVDGNTTYKLFDDFASSLEAALAIAGSRAEQESGVIATGTETIDTGRVEVGLNHRLFQSLYTELKLSEQKTTYSSHVDTDRVSSAQVRYAKKIPDGGVNASYGIAERLHRSAGTEELLVIDEPHVLTTSNPEKLSAQNVVLATIVVTDQFKTITYVEGVDYRISQSGLDTFIEKIGVAIQDGQTVLVTYRFINPRRSFTGRTDSYSLGVRWMFVEPYLRVTETTEEASEASTNASLTLNPGRTEIYGVNIEQRLWDVITPQFTAENEKSRFRVDPFNRQSRNALVSVEIAVGIGSSVFWKQVQIDHLQTPYDSDVTTAGVDAFYARGRVRVDLRASQERSLVADTLHTVANREAKLTTWYGQWVLESTLRLAHDAFRNSGIVTARFDRDLNAFTLGVKRVF